MPLPIAAEKAGGTVMKPAVKLWCLEQSLLIMEAYAASAAQKGNMATVLESLYKKIIKLREDAESHEEV